VYLVREYLYFIFFKIKKKQKKTIQMTINKRLMDSPLCIVHNMAKQQDPM